LSFVGGEYGDGLIYGVAIGVPKGVSQDQRLEIDSVIRRLKSFTIDSERWSLRTVTGTEDIPHTLRRTTWEGPSRVWASVTPLEVNWKGYKGGRRDNIPFIKQLCEWQGLPPVEWVDIRHDAFWNGSIPAKLFKSHNKLNGRDPNFQLHAEIRFRDPVRGPLALGNLGLGVFKPVREAQQ